MVERQKSFKALTRRHYTTDLREAVIRGADNVEHVLRFSKGITLLCGGNGAGKSTVLQAILHGLAGGDQLGLTGFNRQYWASEIELFGAHDGKDWHVAWNFESLSSTGACTPPFVYIDASAETERIIRLMERDDNPEDLIEGIDPFSLEKRDVELLSYVLRRDFDEVNVYEVTAFSEDDSPTPFFEVVSMGRRYNVLGMGRGELAATYLLWKLIGLTKGTIALIEEPESHLADFSQAALLEVMVALIVSRDVSMVISSHSPNFVRMVPSGHAVLLSSSPKPAIRCDLSTDDICRYLGLRSSRDAVLIVEDFVAAELLRTTLASVAPDIANRVSIKYAQSGESGVTRTIGDIKEIGHVRHLPVLGVLDGDQRPSQPNRVSSQFGYLVGCAAPEVVIREAVNAWRSGDYSDWSPSFVGGATSLHLALEECDGLEHHDWIIRLAQTFGGVSRVVDEFTGLLLANAENLKHVEELVQWIRDKLDPARSALSST